MKSWSKLFLLALAAVLLPALPALAVWQTAAVAVGSTPLYMAVDPVRDRIFTSNISGNTVTVVNGKTNATQTWTVGSQPEGMAVNPITGKLYLLITGSATNDTVLVLDTLGVIVHRLAVKHDPGSMVLDMESNRLFVANNQSDTISVFQDDVFLASIPVKSGPKNMALNPVNRTIYLTYDMGDSVACINIDALNLVHIYSGLGALGLAVNASVNKAYVANRDEDSVAVIDCATNTVLKKIPVGDLPYTIVCDPAAQRAYTANYQSGTVSVINCATDVRDSTIEAKANPYSMAVNSVTRKLYVTGSTNWVMMIDGQNVGAKDSVNLGHYPMTLALNPVTNKIYAAMEAGTIDSMAVIDGSDFDTTMVATNDFPREAAVNPITGEVYVTNANSDNVTVIQPDGDTLIVPVGDYPKAVAVNPLTNKIFVANYFSKSVSVIDGVSHTVERTIAVDTLPCVVAVNPLTNYIYVGSYSIAFNRIKVIDGKDWDTSSVQVGARPQHIAVNTGTNRVYVVNTGTNTLSVINAASGHSVMSTVIMSTFGVGIAVNPEANKIYVPHYGNNTVTILDGATNVKTSVTVGQQPGYLTANPACNRIYVTCYTDSSVWMIDGATNAASVLPARIYNAGHCASDPVTGRVFVCNAGSDRITIIDCVSGDTMSLATAAAPAFVTVDPVAGKAYVICSSIQRVLVIDQTVEQDTKVNTYDYNPAPWDHVIGDTPVQQRSQTTINHWSQYKTRINSGLFSLASAQSFWKFGANATATDSSLTWETQYGVWGSDTAFYGENIFRRFGLETQSASTNNLGIGTPFLGNVLNSILYRIDDTAPNIAWWDSLADDNDSLDGYGPYTVRTVITDFSGVDYATLYYQMAGKSWPSVAMTRASADTFIAEIPVQAVIAGDTAVMSYLFDAGDHANDANNNSNTISSNTRSFRLRNLTAMLPAISYVDTLPNDSMEAYGPYPVKAVVTDDKVQYEVKLLYQINGGTADTLAMVAGVADTFAAEIPEQIISAGDSMVISYWVEARDSSLNKTASGILTFKAIAPTGLSGNPSDPALPKTFALQPAYPNPSRGQAVIKYQLPKASTVQLHVYNVAGQLVKTFNEGQKPAGYHQINWKDTALSNGIYFYKLNAGEFSATRKLVILK